MIIANPEDFENDDPELGALLRELEAQEGRVSRFPEKRWYGETDREALLAEGRAEWGHPGTWKPEAEVAEAEEIEVPLCGKRIHRMTPANSKQGQCRSCINIGRKRKRAADSGNPLCWMAKHPEPVEGEVCPCGDVPPADDFIDWVLVENAVSGRALCRPLTNAEQVCALTTVVNRWDTVSGVYEARTWLREYTDVRLSEQQVKYLVIKWLPANGGEALSAGQVFLREWEATAGQGVRNYPTAA